MAAVVAKAADVTEELRKLAKAGIEGVVIANYNSPEQTVIAGLRLVETADDLHVYHDQSWQDFAR